ncbi:MAG TPA: DUF2284 domain-containing protein [Methanomassiliicoccales archaeon]|nr:DUF2284 domain-containing protein [Methanomassiliicoccales archaeon]
MTIESDLEKLRLKAIELGAKDAKTIQAKEVVIDPRVRLKCSVPICDSYGHNRMCPPNVISVEEFASALFRYRHGLLVQFEMDWGEDEVRRLYKGETLATMHNDKAYVDKMTEAMCKMSTVLCELEKDALYMGHRFAVAFSGGCCRLCDECVGPGPDVMCRHPFQARPSMEAMGIDVVATAEKAGMKLVFPARDKAIWTGLILVD